MTLGDTGIGFWFGQQGQDVTLDEYMTDVFNSSGVVSVQQKDVKKFLDSAFVKNFVTDRLNGYISDFMYGTGEGSINVDEVMSLLGDNWAEVSVKLGIDNAKVKGKHRTISGLRCLQGYITDLCRIYTLEVSHCQNSEKSFLSS